MERPDVIIMGAGAAGLAASRVLSRAGQKVLLVEARNRIGGRIWTINDRDVPMPIELGAEFIHGRPDATWKLVRDAGLVAYDLPFEHWRRAGGRLRRIENYEDVLSKVTGGLPRLRRDMSFAEYLRTHRAGRASPEARRIALDFIEGFDAADPERISAKSIAREQEGLGDVGEEMQFRLLGGYGPLLDYLLNATLKAGAVVRLQTQVKEVAWRKSRVEVLVARRGRRTSETLVAPRAIVALPLGVLQLPPASPNSIRFVPEITDKRRSMTRLVSGPVVKAILKYADPFWEGSATNRAARSSDSLRDASFLHDPKAPFPTWWTQRPLRVPVLTAWAGGPRAAALSALPASHLEAIATASLAQVLGRRERSMPKPERVLFYDWQADPFSQGAYSYEGVGGQRARSVLAKPLSGTLFFAGEATDTAGQASTVAGALASGERAANELLDSL